MTRPLPHSVIKDLKNNLKSLCEFLGEPTTYNKPVPKMGAPKKVTLTNETSLPPPFVNSKAKKIHQPDETTYY